MTVEVRDLHPWRAAISIGAGAILVGMILQIWIIPTVNDLGYWWISEDAWTPLRPARAVAEGRLAHLYGADPRWIAGPLVPILLAPIWIVAQWFDLSSPLSGEADRPTLWLVYGPLVLGWSMPFLYAVRALAAEARRNASALGGLVRVQWGAVALVLLPTALLAGHLEDLIAITLIALAARSALRGEITSGAIWLGLAIVTKQWALLAAPAVFAMTPTGSRTRWLAIAMGIPGVVYGGLLLADPQSTGRALFEGLAFPAAGKPALFVDPTHPLVGTPFRATIVLMAVALGVLVARRPTARPLLAAIGLSLLVRLALEPVLFAYYPAPALAFLGLREYNETSHVRSTLVIGLVMTVLFPWEPSSPTIWWIVQGVLFLLLAAPAVRDLVGPKTERRVVMPMELTS
ncbi:MAG TPA: hypothetical protein VFI35_00655 [Actinomycetota bacterium]|nr:hypothetical protein [Actinomycetota bacterium]